MGGGGAQPPMNPKMCFGTIAFGWRSCFRVRDRPLQCNAADVARKHCRSFCPSKLAEIDEIICGKED